MYHTNQSTEEKIVKFFGFIEREAQKMEYGSMTVTVLVSKGLPMPETTNIVKSKRVRFKIHADPLSYNSQY